MVEDYDIKLVCFVVVTFLADMHKGVSLVISSEDGVLNDIFEHNEIIQRHLLFLDFTDVISVSLSKQKLKRFSDHVFCLFRNIPSFRLQFSI